MSRRTRPPTPSGCGAGRNDGPRQFVGPAGHRAPPPGHGHRRRSHPPRRSGRCTPFSSRRSTNWALTVVVENSWQTAFTALLSVSGLQRTSQRVRVAIARRRMPPPAHMLRLGFGANSGSNVSLLFPGDVWAPDAVAQLASALSPRTVVYADEDTVTRDRGSTSTHASSRRTRPNSSSPPPTSGGRWPGCGHRARAWRRRPGASPTWSTISPCGPARWPTRSSTSPRCCATGCSPLQAARRRRARGRSRQRPPSSAGARRPVVTSRPDPAAPIAVRRHSPSAAEHDHHHSLPGRAAVHARLHRVDRRHQGRSARSSSCWSTTDRCSPRRRP